MNIKYLKNRRIFACVFLFVIVSFAQDSHSFDESFSFNSEQDFKILATVGDIKITAKEFQLNYIYGPAFLKRQKDSKSRYLNIMINEKILALEGYAQNLQENSHVKNTLAQINADLITEELFKEDVMSSVSVSVEETEKAVQEDLKHIHIKWLFQKTLKRVSKDFNLLSKGVEFDSLFNVQLSDSVLVDERSMQTTLYELGNKNPVLKSIIDTLKVGSFTHPIKIEDGYYIIKINSGWSDVLLTETEWNTYNEKMQKALFKKKMDFLSDQYVDNLLREINPSILRPALNVLRAWLAQKTLPKELFSAWNLLENTNIKNDQYLAAAVNLSPKLIQLNTGAVSLSEFISWYNPRNSYIKLSQKSKQAFTLSVQSIVWRMLRDKLLTERARQRGLQNRENIVQQKLWWKDKTVYAKYKLELANSFNITDAEIRDYYEKNKVTYRAKNGKYQPIKKVKGEIKNILRRDKYSSKLIHEVLLARQKYKIEINQQFLNEIIVDIENDPRAIEVYTVKKGGLFPRQPYPTIDSEWQYWF